MTLVVYDDHSDPLCPLRSDSWAETFSFPIIEEHSSYAAFKFEDVTLCSNLRAWDNGVVLVAWFTGSFLEPR